MFLIVKHILIMILFLSSKYIYFFNKNIIYAALCMVSAFEQYFVHFIPKMKVFIIKIINNVLLFYFNKLCDLSKNYRFNITEP